MPAAGDGLFGLKKVESYPLSDSDINIVLGGTKIFTYPDLSKFGRLEDIFDSHGRAMMLFLTTSDTNGHWVCFLKRGNAVEYFDPYGLPPEADKKWLSRSKLIVLGEQEPLLSRLIRQSGMAFSYNKHKYQKDMANNNTCGRHCCVRLLNKDLTEAQYYQKIKNSGMNADEYVTKVIYNLLGR